MRPAKRDLQREIRFGMAVLKELHIKETGERCPSAADEWNRAVERCRAAEELGITLGYWPPRQAKGQLEGEGT